MPCRIIHIPRRFDASSWGGTEQVIWQISRMQNLEGHDARVFCPDAPGMSYDEQIHGVPTRHFSYFYPFLGLSREEKARLDKKGGNIFSFSLMRALKRESDLSLLHLHTLKRVGGIGRYVARAKGIPYIVHLHGGLYDVPPSEAQDMVAPIQGKFEYGKVLGAWVGSRQVLEEAGAVVCVGKREAALVTERHPGKRVIALPNGVDEEHFAEGDGAAFREEHGIPHDALLLLQVARLDHQKNQLGLIEAMPAVLGRYPTARLAFVGPTTNAAYVEKMRERIAALGLEACVQIIGAVDPASGALRDSYHCADLVLLPSLHEPFGITILESWAAGRPVVAARVGGIPDFVEDGKDGILFDSGSEEGLAQAIFDALAMEKLASGEHPLGVAGREKVHRYYTWREVSHQLMTLYEEVIDAHSVR